MEHNFFLLLELPLNPPELDWSEIEKAIKAKQRQWSTETTSNPKRALQAKANLELIPQIRRDLANEKCRNEIAAEAIILNRERENEKRAELQQDLHMASHKGYLTEEEIKLLAKQHKVDANQVRGLAHVPIKVQPKQTQKVSPLAKTTADQIRENLQLLKQADLYAFLRRTHSSSLSTLEQASKEMDREVRSKSRKTGEVTAAGTLVGHCLNLFKTAEKRAAYDATLVQEGLAILDKRLDAAGLTKKIVTTAYDALMKLAVTHGLTQDEASDYIEKYADKRKWALQLPVQLSVATLKRCGPCGNLNEPRGRNCSACGFPLVVVCPNCGRKGASIERVCPECSFSLGDMANAQNLVKAGLLASFKKDFHLAEQLLREALVFWPGQPEAESELSQIASQQEHIAQLASKLSGAVSARKYHEAKKILKQLQQKDPNHSALSEEAEIWKRISDAAEQVRLARATSNPDEALRCYTRAKALCSDDSDALSGMASVPPSPPKDLKCELDLHAASLHWQASASQGRLRYRVIRKQANAPRHYQDGQLVSETPATSYEDAEIPVGKTCYYAVFSERGGAYSDDAARVGPMLRLAEVEKLAMMPGDRRLSLSWQAPEHAVRVEVRRLTRAGKQKLAGTSANGCLDSGLENGQVYSYSVFSVFQDAVGREILSPGKTISGEPVDPPRAIDDLKAQLEDGILSLHWTPPPVGSSRLFCSQKPFRGSPEDRIKASKLAELEEELPVDREGETRRNRSVHGQLWIMPVTVNGELAIFGKAAMVTSLKDVTKLRVEAGEKVHQLKWEWPSGSQRVAIAMRHDREPISYEDPDAVQRSIGQSQYRTNGGYPFPVGKKEYYFKLHTLTQIGGDTLYSAGVPLSYIHTDTAIVYYEIRVDRGFFGTLNGATLMVWAEGKALRLPDAELFKKEREPPVGSDDGTLCLTIPETQISDVPAEFELPLEILEQQVWASLYFKDRKSEKDLRIQKPSKKQMQLF